jgi:hypothetical protein
MKIEAKVIIFAVIVTASIHGLHCAAVSLRVECGLVSGST